MSKNLDSSIILKEMKTDFSKKIINLGIIIAMHTDTTIRLSIKKGVDPLKFSHHITEIRAFLSLSE